MKARLLILSAVALVACRDVKQPAELSGPPDPSKIISDGAHGGNKDFFFLPPMVPLPLNNADFELGKFNNTLKPSLRVEICELAPEKVNGVQVLPKEGTQCIAGNPLKTFPAGSVNVVNLPLKQNGWWTVFGLPADGFYYVLWDTRQSTLVVSKYYRIKVFIAGASEPLGVADVDPMSSLREWKYTNTGQVIQLVDDVLLPIPFRVEKGGGSVLCGDASLCYSTTVTNSSPTGSQTVTVDNGVGAVAGAKFLNGWLPVGPGRPQSVVVTIAAVDLGGTDPVTGVATRPCHTGLQLQQFPGCFNFSTTPKLEEISTGVQFAAPVTVAVCYALQDKSPADPREKFAEMYASGPNELPHPLEDASDVGILSASTRNCSSPPVITAAPTSGLSQLASASWRKIKNGVGSVFGVKTAYGVDLGLGGIATAFSNIGPAISATIQPVGSTEITLLDTSDVQVQVYVRLIGSNHHDGQHQNSVGLPDLPVHFQLAEGNNGAIADLGSEVGNATQVDAVTNSIPIDESPVSGGGYAAVNWAVPQAAGVYHLTVDGAAYGGPITFAVTVENSLVSVLPTRPGYQFANGSAINNAGHVAGWISDGANTLPAFWTSGGPSSLGLLGDGSAFATAINDNDVVVGWGGRGLNYYAFRSKDLTTSDLGAFPGFTSTAAYAINSSEQIVGVSWNQDAPRDGLAWIWQNGVMTDLGLPPNARRFEPFDINNLGKIVGVADDGAYRNAWLLDNGEFTKLPGLSFLGTTEARAINTAGVIVGSSSSPLPNSHTRAVRWINGSITDLGVLPGDTDSAVGDISDDGSIVGISQNGPIVHAVLWRNGEIIELPSAGGTFAQATGINSRGDIVGYSTTSDGVQHAVVWHVPPPTP